VTDTPAPGRKTDRTMPPHRPVIADEIIVAEFKKNRRGETVKVVLRSYEETNIIDIRTWYGEDGKRRPGKGFACGVLRLPELVAAVNKALVRARELGLIEAEKTGSPA
jgi:hypothetical protein